MSGRRVSDCVHSFLSHKSISSCLNVPNDMIHVIKYNISNLEPGLNGIIKQLNYIFRYHLYILIGKWEKIKQNERK